MTKEIIVSNDWCSYKLVGSCLLYNDGQSTGYDDWGEVQLFEHFSKGDIDYMKKQFKQDFWIGCGQFGNCQDQLIDTDDLVEFAKEKKNEVYG